MHFLAAPMLLGLLLASVPIIIHLLNRRRFQLVEWAPMKYLKLTIKTNRRRMRIEQLLLLIVRTAFIAILIFAVARPSLSSARLTGWLASRSRTSRIIVVDDSLSMGYRVDRASALDSAKKAAEQLIRAIGPQDAVTVLRTSHPDAPLVREASLTDPAKLLSQLATITPSDAANDWPATFKRIDDLLSTATHPQKELIVVTDLRRAGWSANVGEQSARWATQSIGMKLIDVGSRDTDNVALSRFEQEDPVALPGVPLKLRASIRNDSPILLHGKQATLEIDEQSRPLALPDLLPGQTTELPLNVTLAQAGQHTIKLTLPGDALPGDDVRWLEVSVRPKIDLALVDGVAGSAPFESTCDYLHVAFTAGADPWQVSRRSDAEWQAQPASNQLSGADVIVLANVGSLSPQQVAQLEKLVSAGAGLMIFAGDQVDPSVYDELLYRNGAGLLPARLENVIDEPANGLVIEAFDDSPLSPLTKIAPEALARVRAKRFVGVTIERSSASKNEGVRVLAHLNDAEAHPAIIEKRFGRGRVLLWTISADRQWSDWPVDPTYVLATRSAALAVARPDFGADNFTAGHPITFALPDGQRARNPHIVGPTNASAEPMTTSEDGLQLRHAHAPSAGLYVLHWKDARDEDRSHALAASFDAAESDLSRIADADLTQLVAPMSVSIVHWAPGGEALTERGREIWKTLAFVVLGLGIFESALAVWVGRER